MQSRIHLKPLFSLLALVVLTFTLIILIGRVLIPFIIALILTYILNPVIEKIYSKFKINRSIISLIFSLLIFFLFLSIPVFIIPTLVSQLKIIITKIPTFIELINTKALPMINHNYGTHFNLDLNKLNSLIIDNLSRLSSNLDIFSPLAKNSLIIIEVMIYIILIPFILFYSIINWHILIKFFDQLIPRGYLRAVHHIIGDIDHMLSAYLRGQLAVMLIMAIYYGIALSLTGLPSGFMLGFITGLLVFIPYLGIITGLLLSLLVAFASFTEINQIFIILGIFAVGHVLEGGIVTPFLVGGKIGLNPVMVILSLLIFGKLFGFVGILLALPLSTITIVLLKYMRDYYIKSEYYTDTE